jgi:predicted HTH domain antitoxin
MTLIDFEEDVEILRKSGDFSSREEFLEETFRAFLKEHPELRVKLAVEKYRSGSVTLNRAAEVAGLSTEEFKGKLAEHGVTREPGFLSEEERDEELSKL